VAALRPGPTRRKITIYGWSTSGPPGMIKDDLRARMAVHAWPNPAR
jgi:hypothetical protein